MERQIGGKELFPDSLSSSQEAKTPREAVGIVRRRQFDWQTI